MARRGPLTVTAATPVGACLIDVPLMTATATEQKIAKIETSILRHPSDCDNHGAVSCMISTPCGRPLDLIFDLDHEEWRGCGPPKGMPMYVPAGWVLRYPTAYWS